MIILQEELKIQSSRLFSMREMLYIKFSKSHSRSMAYFFLRILQASANTTNVLSIARFRIPCNILVSVDYKVW